MGLAERRAVKAYQDDIFPGKKKEIDEVAGFDVPLEIDWVSLSVEDYGHLYEEGFTKVYFDPLIAALKSICRDDMGREALREGLKKVVIRNSDTYYHSGGFKFEDGILTLDNQPCTNMDDFDDRMRGLERMLEKGL